MMIREEPTTKEAAAMDEAYEVFYQSWPDYASEAEMQEILVSCWELLKSAPCVKELANRLATAQMEKHWREFL